MNFQPLGCPKPYLQAPTSHLPSIKYFCAQGGLGCLEGSPQLEEHLQALREVPLAVYLPQPNRSSLTLTSRHFPKLLLLPPWFSPLSYWEGKQGCFITSTKELFQQDHKGWDYLVWSPQKGETPPLLALLNTAVITRSLRGKQPKEACGILIGEWKEKKSPLQPMADQWLKG